MPRFRLAFTVNPGQPRGMINAAWLSLLPGPAALMMMDRVSGRLWSRRLAQAAGRPLRPRLSLTRGLCRNLGMITLTGVTGHCGGCVPLPPSCGGWVPQPPLPGAHDRRGHRALRARSRETGVTVHDPGRRPAGSHQQSRQPRRRRALQPGRSIGPRPDAMKPDIQGVRTHWNRGFMAFKRVRRRRSVVLMVLAWPESGFGDGAAPPAAVGSAALPLISMNAASMLYRQGG